MLIDRLSMQPFTERDGVGQIDLHLHECIAVTLREAAITVARNAEDMHTPLEQVCRNRLSEPAAVAGYYGRAARRHVSSQRLTTNRTVSRRIVMAAWSP